MYDTIQIKIMPKYRLLFGDKYSELKSKESVSFDDFLDKLWINYDIVREFIHINNSNKSISKEEVLLSMKRLFNKEVDENWFSIWKQKQLQKSLKEVSNSRKKFNNSKELFLDCFK